MTIPLVKKAIDIYHVNKRSFIAYCAVGVLNVLLYTGLYVLLDKILKLSHIFALSLSFVVAATFQFMANRIFSFQSSSKVYAKDVLKYCILLVINYLISVVTVLGMNSINQPDIYGIFVSCTLSPFVNYFLFRYWIFQQLDHQ